VRGNLKIIAAIELPALIARRSSLTWGCPPGLHRARRRGPPAEFAALYRSNSSDTAQTMIID